MIANSPPRSARNSTDGVSDPETDSPTRLILVRHGESRANVLQVWHGHTDTELTERGWRQLEHLSEAFHPHLQPHAIYASPLQRALNTARGVAQRFAMEVVEDSRLIEFGLGEWEGKPFNEMDDDATMRRLMEDPRYATPGGESQHDVRDRVFTLFDELLDSHQGQRVAIFSHGVTIGILLAHYLHQDTCRWPDFHSDNTGVWVLNVEERRLELRNCLAHLPQELQGPKG